MSRRRSLTLHGVEDATAAQLDDFDDLFFGDTRAGSSERRQSWSVHTFLCQKGDPCSLS